MTFFLRTLMVGVLLVAADPAHAVPTFVGPRPYLCQSDSPFELSGLGSTFFLEDFEDGLLNTPGVMADTGGPIGPGGLTDSVDCDDGATDGSGTNGHSFFTAGGASGITFTFDAGVLSGFPTAAGIVWSDGDGDTSFEAFDALSMPLGGIGPVTIATGGVTGQTDEDRFFGVYEPGGISAIKISNTSGGIEVDHLQYGASTLVGSATTTTTTTSTTLPSGDCGSTPVGATFASLDCRLAALIARVQSTTDIRRPQTQTQLLKQLTKAKERKEQAETACAASDAKHARSRLKQTVRKMIQFGQRLRSNTGRRAMTAALRAELIAAGDAIKTDLQTLRGRLACPQDALG